MNGFEIKRTCKLHEIWCSTEYRTILFLACFILWFFVFYIKIFFPKDTSHVFQKDKPRNIAKQYSSHVNIVL